MPLPGTWNNVTVTATFLRADTGGPAAGAVVFVPQRGIGIDDTVVLPNPITATLNGSGQITASLPCPDDAGAGFTTLVYKVIERIPFGREYFVQLDNTMTAEVLGDLDPLTDDQAAYYSFRGPPGDVTPELLAAKDAAEDAATAAAGSQSAAAGSAAAAASSAGAAAGSATTASTQAGNASTSADTAASSASAASGSAGAAASSAAAADASADAAAISASTAESAAGPTYASIALGEAATTVGQSFAVDPGTGIVSVYLRTGGGSTLQRTLATTAALAADSGAELVTFKQAGAGSVARKMRNKAQEMVSVLDFIPEAEHAAIRARTSNYDCHAAIMAAINSMTIGTGWYVSGPNIYFPPGRYSVGSTIELKKCVTLRGEGSGLSGGNPTELLFPADVPGIIVHRYNTIGTTTEGTPTTAADGSIIEGLRIAGARGSNAEAHGVRLRARAILRNIVVTNFTADGIHISATAGGPPHLEGNANLWKIDTASVGGCGGRGLFVTGADANAGVCSLLDASANGRTGIYDASFLGNTYIGCHVAENGCAQVGKNTASQSSFVTYGGNRYAAHPSATDAQLVATTPGTNANIWAFYGSGGTHPLIPQWVAGSPEGTYFRAFGYWCDSPNASNVFLGCYWESGAAGNAFAGPCVVLGGSLGWRITGDAIRAQSDGRLTVNSITASSAPVTASFSPGNGEILSWSYTGEIWGWSLMRLGNDFSFVNGGVGNRVALTLTGENTTATFGTASPKPYVACTPIFGLGYGSYARRITYSVGAPTAGEWAQGDVVFNAAPSAGGKVGWVCVAGGTPGTWKAFGAIDP